MPAKEPLAEALRAEILKLATEGDAGKEGALTPDVLLRILRVAKTGRDLLVSLQASPQNLAALVKRPKPFGLPVVGDHLDEDLAAVEVGPASPFVPYATASLNENFGMTAIREIIAAAKNLNGNGTSPAKIVEAIAVARENGLDDVARDLEAELGLGKGRPAPLPAPAEKKEPAR